VARVSIHGKWLATHHADDYPGARNSRVNARIAPERIDPQLSKPETSILLKYTARWIQNRINQ
jgi:hypothetical protein